MSDTRLKTHAELEQYFASPRFAGILRTYTADRIIDLRGSLHIEHTLARRGAEKFWVSLNSLQYVHALGAENGHQAVQMVRNGLKAIYCSGWQVAGNSNTASQTYPDQSLYPADSVPELVRRINNALQRQDQIQTQEGTGDIDWYAPIVADAEAGFGGILNAFELMKAMIEAGASAVHYEDQLASEKKCGHMGGKVVIPTSQFIDKLVAARLASDIMDVPTILIARTDADSAKLIANDIDPRDKPFIEGERDPKGFFRFTGGLDAAIARGLAYAPYADLIWCETSNPKLEDAERFAQSIHEKFPGKLLAYNCSPSFNWKKYLGDDEILKFQTTLAQFGYAFQFITLAGFHANNLSMFELSRKYQEGDMAGYVALQEREFALQNRGYTAVKHQREVGTGYFDAVQMAITGDNTDTVGLKDSTEKDQFK